MTAAARCTLLSGPFERFVQALLGIFALSTLFVKRKFERPQRELQIWALDACKQCAAAALSHGLNIGTAIVLAKNIAKDDDECAFYFLGGLVDTTLGVYVNYLLLQFTIHLAKVYDCTSLQRPGSYGDFKTWDSRRRWLIEFSCWIGIVLFSKILMSGVLLLLLYPLGRLVQIIFAVIQPYPKMELILVMLVFPSIMNSVQFWIQDNFTMHQGEESQPLVP